MPSKYLIDPILPCGEIHLLGGPTGAGKTRWLFDTLLDWQKGIPVLGYRSNPCPWLYVSADRSAASVYRTLDSMGIAHSAIPLYAAMDSKVSVCAQVLDEAKRRDAKFIVIESFVSFVQQMTSTVSTKQIKQFFYSFRDMLNDGLTILAVMESPKMKPKERYDNPRQRISGAAAWGHYAETIILIEPTTPDKPSSTRNIIVCPRNEAEIVIEAQFEHGHLIPLSATSAVWEETP